MKPFLFQQLPLFAPDDPPAPPPPENPPPAPPPPKPEGDSLLGSDPPPPEPKKETEPPKPEDPPKPAGAPETYSDFTLPEGFSLQEEGLKEATGLFKELNLSQEAAQRLIDMHAKTVETTIKAVEEAGLKAWQELRKQWTDQVKADPELGGENTKEVTATIAKALSTYGDPGVREALQMTGADNHPAVLRTLYKMAKALTEGTTPRGGKPPGDKTGKTLAERLYPEGPKGIETKE